MRTFKLEDKAHIDNEENSPHTVKECLEHIINHHYDGDMRGIETYFNELLKDGGGTSEYDDRLELCWKDCVWNENWEEFEMVKNVANIIFD